MRVSHAAAAVGIAFDDPNLIADRRKTRYRSHSATAIDHTRQPCPATLQVSVMDDQFDTHTPVPTQNTCMPPGYGG